MTTVNEDIETISANPSRITLTGADIEVDVEKLRTRQLFRFLKILTVGAGPLLAELNISSDLDTDELTQQLLGILIVSIPEAEDEAIDFVKSMVKPIDLIEPERSKADRQANVEAYNTLWASLNNPEIEDTITILTHVVKTEAPNLVSLGKQIAAMLPSAAKPTTSSKKRSTKSTPAAS